MREQARGQLASSDWDLFLGVGLAQRERGTSEFVNYFCDVSQGRFGCADFDLAHR